MLSSLGLGVERVSEVLVSSCALEAEDPISSDSGARGLLDEPSPRDLRVRFLVGTLWLFPKIEIQVCG